MAEIKAKITITVLDMPEVQRLFKRYEKISKKRAWKHHTRMKKRGMTHGRKNNDAY